MDQLLHYCGLAVLSGAALYVVLGTFNFVYTYFLSPGKDLRKYGQWAVVTGATDGIGKAYAFELARKGLHVVLVSRTLSKLQEVAKEIEAKHKVTTKVVSADFTGGKEIYGDIERTVKDLDVGVLINNVGIGYDHPEYFADLAEDKINAMMRCNMDSVTRMTHIVLPGMVARKRGAIVNIASSSGWYPMGLLSLYSATKAYVDFFSQGLALEYAGKGIDVQCVLPMFVTSKLSKIRKASAFVPNPDTFARSAVALIGKLNKTTGYWAHAIQITFLMALPASIRDKLTMDANLSTRKRALKKRDADAKAQ